MKLIKKLIPEDAACATHESFGSTQPTTITIHWTGPYPGQSPEMVRDWWIKSKGKASAHVIIKNDTVLQCWELDQIAWHAGCVAGNTTSIGIEVIPENTEGKFSDKSIATLKEYLATIPDLPLVRHFDWTGKDCPKYYCDSAKWKELLKQLGKDKM